VVQANVRPLRSAKLLSNDLPATSTTGVSWLLRAFAIQWHSFETRRKQRISTDVRQGNEGSESFPKANWCHGFFEIFRALIVFWWWFYPFASYKSLMRPHQRFVNVSSLTIPLGEENRFLEG